MMKSTVTLREILSLVHHNQVPLSPLSTVLVNRISASPLPPWHWHLVLLKDMQPPDLRTCTTQ